SQAVRAEPAVETGGQLDHLRMIRGGHRPHQRGIHASRVTLRCSPFRERAKCSGPAHVDRSTLGVIGIISLILDDHKDHYLGDRITIVRGYAVVPLPTPRAACSATRSPMKRARARIEARKGRVNGLISGRLRHSSTGAASLRPTSSSSTCGGGSSWT